jgi:hypothetical protein
MDKFTEWLHTGESENGVLQVWCKIDTIDDVKYLKMQYRDADGKIVGTTQDYSVSHIKMLNGLIDCYRMEYGVDI